MKSEPKAAAGGNEKRFWEIELPPCPACGGELEIARGRVTGKYFIVHKQTAEMYHYFDSVPTIDEAIASVAHPRFVDAVLNLTESNERNGK